MVLLTEGKEQISQTYDQKHISILKRNNIL